MTPPDERLSVGQWTARWLDGLGSSLLYGSYLGGGDTDYAFGIAPGSREAHAFTYLDFEDAAKGFSTPSRSSSRTGRLTVPSKPGGLTVSACGS